MSEVPLYTALIFSFGVLPQNTNDVDAALCATAQCVICDTFAANCCASAKTVESVQGYLTGKKTLPPRTLP